ncbi:MAG: M56 family metallopeptidase [Pseudomonadota bacterium]|nr:M56 family metallopeptidase [Pseudomonadota bacterium]
METLVGLALKSLLIAGATLLLLHLTRRRSSADRSWIAHLGLFALVALPLASLGLPALHIALPEALSPAPAIEELAGPPMTASIAPAPTGSTAIEEVSGPIASPTAAAAAPGFDWTPYAYAAPAVALLLITLLALLRLFALRNRAQVLVDPVWLSALAHAQRRMGFKSGTALLTSNELSSPISWGVMRPVILLNDEALAATGEAEAIIAHELAHVARLDWAKLMLARVATAIFWFNPLAWLLAREAHQLREEAADDAVLAANIADTDYAQLLVGVARHECKGLLLGAHGISPGKGSLRRRVSRVLDGTLVRKPGARSWVAGFAAGMLVMAAPLAALTFAPKAEDKLSDEDVAGAEGASAPVAQPTPIAATSQYAEQPRSDEALQPAETPRLVERIVSDSDGSRIENRADGTTVIRNSSGAMVTVQAADAGGRRKLVMRSASGATLSFADANDAAGMGAIAIARAPRGPHGPRRSERSIDSAIEMKVLGVTSDYIASIRAAGPQFRNLDADDFVELKVKRVTPQFVRSIIASGYGNASPDDIGDAAVMGVTSKYVSDMAAAGYRNISLEELTEMRVMGVNRAFIEKMRNAGYPRLSPEQLVKLRTLGVEPGEFRNRRPPPRPPHPVGAPTPHPAPAPAEPH